MSVMNLDKKAFARCICRIFIDNDLAQTLGNRGCSTAKIRHDRQVNANNMLEIYQQVISSK